MTTLTTTTRAATAVAIAGITASLLTGCFNPAELVNRGVEDAIEGATGGDVSLGGELPADFPTSIPLIDGDVTFAGGAGRRAVDSDAKRMPGAPPGPRVLPGPSTPARSSP